MPAQQQLNKSAHKFHDFWGTTPSAALSDQEGSVLHMLVRCGLGSTWESEGTASGAENIVYRVHMRSLRLCGSYALMKIDCLIVLGVTQKSFECRMLWTVLEICVGSYYNQLLAYTVHFLHSLHVLHEGLQYCYQSPSTFSIRRMHWPVQLKASGTVLHCTTACEWHGALTGTTAALTCKCEESSCLIHEV